MWCDAPDPRIHGIGAKGIAKRLTSERYGSDEEPMTGKGADCEGRLTRAYLVDIMENDEEASSLGER